MTLDLREHSSKSPVFLMSPERTDTGYVTVSRGRQERTWHWLWFEDGEQVAEVGPFSSLAGALLSISDDAERVTGAEHVAQEVLDAHRRAVSLLPPPPDYLPEGAVRCPGCSRWVYRQQREHGGVVYTVFLTEAQVVLDSGMVGWRPIYGEHHCASLVKVLDATTDRARSHRVALQQGQQERRETERKFVLEQARSFACPKCEEPEGQDCLNLVERAKGRSVKTKWPHPLREALVHRAIRDGEIEVPVRLSEPPPQVAQAIAGAEKT